MKRLLLFAAAALALASCHSSAQAAGVDFQSIPVKGAPIYVQLPDGTFLPAQADSSGNITISGTISASLSGFTPTAGQSKDLSVSGTSSDTTLPTGNDIVVTNTGSVDARVRIQVGAGTAVTTDQMVKAGAAVGMHVGTATHISAITAGGSTNLNIQGGAGLAAGYGGSATAGSDASAANQTAVQATAGSDASKAVAVQGITGGKALGVSAADGSVVTLGTITDAASCASGQSLLACTRQLHTDMTGPLPAQSSDGVKIGAVQGTVASGSTADTYPLLMGGRAATAAPTAVTDGQTVRQQFTETGRTVTAPYSIKELMIRGTATSTDTSAHTIIASAGGSLKNYITAAQCGRTDAGSSALTITFNDSASTVVVLPAGGATNIVFPTPLATAAATAFQFTSGTGVTTLICSAQGYTGL